MITTNTQSNRRDNLTSRLDHLLEGLRLGRRQLLSLLSLFIITACLAVTASAQTTVVVNQTSASGWLLYDDETDKIDPTLGSFVAGPGTAPLGTGSMRISVTGSQRRNLATYQFSGTVLSTITELKFSTYNPSAGNGGSASRSGYLNFNVDFTGSDLFQRRLVFVPSQNGAVVQDTWQEWDAINGGAALWSYSGPTWPITGQPGTFLKSWSQILSDYPGVRIKVTDAFLGIRVGEPYPDGYTENIDAFKFGTGAGTTQYDFDPATALAVSPAAVPNQFDNDYTRINNAIQAATSGTTITLSGTFDWTEPNAAASWALGSDGQTGTPAFENDDYSILARAGLNGVTVTSASLGAATIQGPGDLAAVNLEGVLQFYSGGLNQNWTISNLRFLDFDNAIGFYFAGGPSTVYNGTTITNNYIRIPRDLNATVAPADVNQNIGIHFSFGSGQTISGNTIDFAGDGVSDGANFSSEVGMQSNTSGGSVYEGLQITNNTLRVLNAQSAMPESMLGIWDNGHAHTSNITISGNSFSNLAGGNNPALNLERGFRVTSHSSATSTVTYSNNRVSGANIGFQWIAGSAFSGNLAVRLISNTLLSNGTAVLVQSAGVANLSFNRIVGNTTGVSNVDGVVIAENNWWGCNNGPGLGGAGCSGTANGTTGMIDSNPWLRLTTAAVPSAVVTGGSSTIISKLTINSDAMDTSGSGSVADITPLNFVGTLGTVVPMSTTTTAGVGTTLFTAGAAAGSGGVTTTIDAQTVNAPISITFSCNNVSVPANTNTLRNAVVTIPISTDSLTGRGILSFDFSITYNSGVVTPLLTPYDQTGTLSSGMIITVNNSTPGVLLVSGFGSSPLSGAGTLLNLKFLASGPIGSVGALNFTSFAYNEGVPCSVTTNGTVTIISGTISGAVMYSNAAMPPKPVPNTVLSAAGSVPVSTNSAFISGAYSLSGMGPGPYTVTPSKVGDVNGITGFDSALIAQHVVLLITLNSTQLLAADVSGNNVVTSFDAALIARYVALLPGSGSTGDWIFSPLNRSYANAESNQSGQDYGGILMGEVSGNWVPPTSFARGLEKNVASEKGVQVEAPVPVIAPTALVPAGMNFTVPVNIGATIGENIISYQFDITYNSLVIQPQANPVDVTGTLSAGRLVTFNVISPGLLKVVVFGTANINGPGVLLNFKFTAVGLAGQTSPMNWATFMFNEDDNLDIPVNGLITLAAPTAAGAEVGGRLTTSIGNSVSNARVTITDTLGETRTTLSTSLGFYRFTNVQVGQTYIITVQSKRYTFTPTAVSIGQELTNVDLIADY